MNSKDNFASMAVMWQKLSAESYRLARYHARKGHYSLACFYQRQGARDYRVMRDYLFGAIAIPTEYEA